jgi:DNA-binding transcriptional LysR family regulator
MVIVMTNTEIEVFLTIVSKGSISKAAEALYVTQPALSRRLKALEDELGYKLFVREKGRRGLMLTPEGETFAALAEKWQDLLHEMQCVKTNTKNTVLKIGSVDFFNTYVMPLICQKYLHEIHNTDLVIMTVHDWDAYSYITGNKADIAFVNSTEYSKKVATKPVFSERMVLLASGPMILPDIVHPSDLDPSQEVKMIWETNFMQWHDYWFGASTQPRVTVNKMSLVEYFMGEGEKWCIMPASASFALSNSRGFTVHELAEAPPDLVCYCLSTGGKKHPAAAKFVEFMHNYLENVDYVNLI